MYHMSRTRLNERRLNGVKKDVYPEGTHLMVRITSPISSLYSKLLLQLPWFETPIVFDIRAKPRSIASLTGTKGSSVHLGVLVTHFQTAHVLYL